MYSKCISLSHYDEVGIVSYKDGSCCREGGMQPKLDLVLITDEPIAWEGNYWKSNEEKADREMRALGLTLADKEHVEKAFGIKDYFRPLSSPDSGTPSPAPLFRIRVPHRPHLSLCDLATVAQRKGYEVYVLDNIRRFPSRLEQLKTVLREEPKAVGISTTFLLTAPLVRHYVATVKELAPRSKIILGGPSIRKFKDLHGIADFAVFGDGEEALLAILEACHGRRKPETVPNCAYTAEDGTVNYGLGGAPSCRLGKTGKPYKASKVKIPIPDWRLVNRSLMQVLPIEFSRGCQKNCFYCSYDRGKTIRDLSEIREELTTNAELGIRRYRISDSNFTDGPPEYAHYPGDICKLMLELNIGLEWSCYARVDDMTDELAELMHRAGCFAVFFGIESGNDSILKKMNKGHTVADAYEGVKIAKKHGLFCHASFIVGYPGETVETYEDTLEFIEKARPDTVNLGQFRVEHDTIVYGRKEFALEGLGMTWKHKTMDSQMADHLVAQGNERLLKNGICLGTEYGFPTLMGFGLTMGESLEVMKYLDIVGQEFKQDGEEFYHARNKLRDMILNRIPPYIKKDQEAWGLG
jgi:radical SAM superfamily enzyme YgiQ (UPF0313 family)